MKDIIDYLLIPVLGISLVFLSVKLSFIGIRYERELRKENPRYCLKNSLRFQNGRLKVAIPIIIFTKSKHLMTQKIASRFNTISVAIWLIIVLILSLENYSNNF